MDTPREEHDKQEQKFILIDLDGTIADFELEILNRYKKKHPDKRYISLEERTLSPSVAAHYDHVGLEGQIMKVFK